MRGKSRLKNFDRERGDVVVMPREDVRRLFAAGPEIGAQILWRFYAWFLKESCDPLDDVRDRMILDGMIEHQKENAERMYQRLVSQQGNAKKRWKGQEGDKDAAACHGMPRHAMAQEEERESSEEKPSVSDKASLRLRQDPAPSSCDAGCVARGATVSFPSPRYKEQLEIAQRNPESCNFSVMHLGDLARDPATAILRRIGELDSKFSRNTITKYLKRLGKGAVIDAYLEIFDEDEVKHTDVGKVLFGRLKGMDVAGG